MSKIIHLKTRINGIEKVQNDAREQETDRIIDRAAKAKKNLQKLLGKGESLFDRIYVVRK